MADRYPTNPAMSSEQWEALKGHVSAIFAILGEREPDFGEAGMTARYQGEVLVKFDLQGPRRGFVAPRGGDVGPLLEGG